jgi:hypothetical protein
MTGQRSASLHRRRRRALALFALSGTLAMLSGGALATTRPNFAAARTAAKTAPANPLPSMSVTDVRTGKSVALRSALSGKKPLLVWFWAPY